MKIASIIGTWLFLLCGFAVQATQVSLWNKQDVGDFSQAGQWQEQNGTITLNVAGGDIWGTRDNFYFVYMPLKGDITASVRVVSVGDSHPWAKAALMLRESLAPGARNVALDFSAHQRVAVQWREQQDQRSYYWSRAAQQSSVWLRMTRQGDLISGYYSLDGETWQLATSRTLAMGEQVYFGLAASPHDLGLSNQVVFDNLVVESQDEESFCDLQGLQCGATSGPLGNTLQCGNCGLEEACRSNQCQPVLDVERLAKCNAFSAQCGVIGDDLGGSISCGSCGAGEGCYSNRCEPMCSTSQVGGPDSDLFLHLPSHLFNRDISGYQHNVEFQEQASTPWVSRNNLSQKSIVLSLSAQAAMPNKTLGIKFRPLDTAQNARILDSEFVKLTQLANGVELSVKQADASWRSMVNSMAQLKVSSCNQFTAVVSDSGITTYLNGQKQEFALDTSQLANLEGALKMGPYPGYAWDLRVYEKALSQSEAQHLGEDCSELQTKTSPYEDYPNYLCGAYVCEWWPDGITDSSEESLRYYIDSQDKVWERNVLDTGMYASGDICGFYAAQGGRHLQLSEGIRRGFVNKHDYSRPVNQYWLHENFHSFQGNLARYNGFGGSKFLLESTASWGADTNQPGTYDTLLGYYTLQPHMPLWTTQSSPIEDGVIDAFKGGHQYGAYIFERFLSHYYLSDKVIGDVFNDRRASSEPTRVMYEKTSAAGFDMAEVFTEFASRIITWDIQDGEKYLASEIGSFNRMKGANNGQWPEEEVDNKIAEFYTQQGTGDVWTSVPARYKIGSWAYNVYQITLDTDQEYRISVRPSVDNPTYAEFQAKVVRYNPTSGQRIYTDLAIGAGGEITEVEVAAKAGELLYLVITSVPANVFSGWDTYIYDYKVLAL